METKEMLKKEIEFLMGKLHNLEPGTKEHSEATKALCELNKALLEHEEAELEKEKHDDQVVNYERDREIKHKEQRQAWIKMAVDGSIALAGIGVTIGGWKFYKNRMHEVLLYEEKGSISSQAGKNVVNFMNRLLGK